MPVDFESTWAKEDFFSYHQRIRKDGLEKLLVITVRTDRRKPKIYRKGFEYKFAQEIVKIRSIPRDIFSLNWGEKLWP